MSKGGRPKTVETDPYIEMLLTYGYHKNGRTQGFENISDACVELGISRARIYSASRRGVKDIQVMGELAALFRVPKPVFLAFIMQYADDIYDMHTVSSKAS